MNNSSYKLGRRAFLTFCLTGAALIAGGVTFGWTRPRRAWIARKLNAQFYYLHLDPDGVTTFIEVYEEHRHIIRRHPLKLLFEPIPENVMSSYLASTDFFIHGGDESRVVRFMALHDPYVSPCFNPFVDR